MPTEKFKSLFDSLVAKYNPAALKNWTISPSDDLLIDFFHFTDNQGGGKSKDPNDPAAAAMPPEPDVDGNYYHTVRDITWSSYKNILLKNGITPTAKRFYSMSDGDKKIIVADYINKTKKTTSLLINCALAFYNWQGSANPFLNKFLVNNGIQNLQEGIAKYGENVLFDMLMSERITYMRALNPRYALGWSRGCLCFWKLFGDSKKKD